MCPFTRWNAVGRLRRAFPLERTGSGGVLHVHHFPLAHAHEFDVGKTAAKRVDDVVHACSLPRQTSGAYCTVLSLC